MKPRVVSNALPSPVATSIAASQSLAAAGALSLTSSTVTLDTFRRIAIASGGNDSGLTFTIVGTNWAAMTQTEKLTGASATVATSTLDFATVSSVTSSAATAATVSVGTSAKGSTPIVALDYYGAPGTIIQAVPSSVGTPTYQLFYTIDRVINDPPPLTGGYTWFSLGASGSTTQAINLQIGGAEIPAMAVKADITSGTGTLTLSVLQPGFVGS